MSDYLRIAKAIEFITDHVDQQPNLEDIANHVNLSPFHFQRTFSQWVGVSPKRFLQVLTINHAKALLRNSQSVLSTANTLGLSSSSRIYDQFISLEGITPGDFKSQGKNLIIEYGFHQSPFGLAFIATTPRGICRFSFPEPDNIEKEIIVIKNQWPFAGILQNQEKTVEIVTKMFNGEKATDKPLSLYVKGTNFQINVWKALLEIPPYHLTSYSDIARSINKPKSVRAVGSAIGANPVAFLIPCHRVIRQSGHIGGYHWGLTRKHAMHAWEAARY